MSPEEIIDAYNVVIEDLQTNTANRAAAIGNSQRSLGTLAERVASPSGQTSGLANYTYDRTMRPVIDSLSASLTTTGKAQALENLLTTKLRDAKNNYENSRNNYTVASTAPSSNGDGGQKILTESTDSEVSGEKVPYTAAGSVTGVSDNGNGTYDIIYADGNGGAKRRTVSASSSEEARKKGTISGYGHFSGVTEIIFGDGSKKTYLGNSSSDALRNYLEGR